MVRGILWKGEGLYSFSRPWPFPARPRSMEPQLAGCSGKIARSDKKVLTFLSVYKKKPETKNDRITH